MIITLIQLNKVIYSYQIIHLLILKIDWTILFNNYLLNDARNKYSPYIYQWYNLTYE